MTLNHVTRAMHNWLMENNIPLEGVRLIVEFPDKATAGHAEMCIKREIEPMLACQLTGGTFGKIETMNGVGLSLTHR